MRRRGRDAATQRDMSALPVPDNDACECVHIERTVLDVQLVSCAARRALQPLRVCLDDYVTANSTLVRAPGECHRCQQGRETREAFAARPASRA